MKELILTSNNEAKKKATIQAISETFGTGNILKTLSTPSGVRATPTSNEECILGATNRVNFAKLVYPNADYYIGAEGGLNKEDNNWFIGGWVMVESKSGIRHFGSSAWVELPDFLVNLIDADIPLSTLIKPGFFSKDLYENRVTLGTNGLITRGVYTRVNEFYDALKIALSQF